MEAIFMDNSFLTTRYVSAFSSFIWNDVYLGYGDFELRFPMVDGALNGIELGRYVSIRESDRYMIVEGIEMKTSVEEGNIVTITGRSLESLLDRRYVLEQTVLTGSLQDGIFRLLNANLINPSDPLRKMSKFIFRFSTDPRILAETIEYTVEEGANLFNAVYDILQDRHIGFRCLPDDSNATIIFELYMGEDRSYDQQTKPWVVFSPKFENIQETDMVINTENLRNVIYAKTTYTDRKEELDGSYTEEEKTIFIEINDGGYSGMERRELFATSGAVPERISKSDFGKPEDRVNFYNYARYELVTFHEAEYNHDWDVYHARVAQYGYANVLPPRISDYQEFDWVIFNQAGYDAAIEQAERDIQAEYEAAIANAEKTTEALIKEAAAVELAEYMKVSEFNGEVDPNFQYLLGRDYNIGDVVQIVNEYGFQAVTRVAGVMYSEEVGYGFMMRPKFESDDRAVFDI